MSDLDDEIDRLVEEEAVREEEELLELEEELQAEEEERLLELEEELQAEEEERLLELEEKATEEEERLLELEEGLQAEDGEVTTREEERIQPPQLTKEEKKVLPVLPVYELVKEHVTVVLTEAFSTNNPELKFLLPEDLDLEDAVESYTNLVTSSLRYGTTYTRPVQRRVDFLISYLADNM